MDPCVLLILPFVTSRSWNGEMRIALSTGDISLVDLDGQAR